MRSAVAIIFITAVSAWADEHPLTWEPARIVRLEEVVASGILAPTDPHPAFFDFFSDVILENDGSVLFIANGAGRGVSILGREGVYRVDRDGRPSTLIQRGDSLGNEQTVVASIADLDVEDGVPLARCVLGDGNKKTVALGNLTGLTSPCITTGVQNNGRSIYRTGRDGHMQLVVDVATRIPELFEGTFTGFGKHAFAFGPWVIFSGSANTYEGLFAMNMETNRLFLLIDNLASVGDRRIEDFQISGSPRAGADLAVTVSFADGASGIYIYRFGDSRGKLLFAD